MSMRINGVVERSQDLELDEPRSRSQLSHGSLLKLSESFWLLIC